MRRPTCATGLREHFWSLGRLFKLCVRCLECVATAADLQMQPLGARGHTGPSTAPRLLCDNIVRYGGRSTKPLRCRPNNNITQPSVRVRCV